MWGTEHGRFEQGATEPNYEQNSGEEHEGGGVAEDGLVEKGLRYRKNYAALPGKPDIALMRQKIAIFVDGDFWHARGHQDCPGEQVASNRDYWRKKLTRNVERDKDVTDALTEAGWLVLRFWETDIKKDLESCMRQIEEYL